MNKNIIIGILIIILTIISIILLLTIPVDKKNFKQKAGNTFVNIEGYKQKNLERYKNYHHSNLDISKEEVINRVNMNLDYDFYTHTKKANYLNTPKVLVNKYYYLEKDYIPKDLEIINDGYSVGGKKLVHDARIAFEQMASDAYNNENLHLRAVSAYRSYKYQERLYNSYKEKDGKNSADTYSARPGFSEHQTGLSLDIDNINTDFNNFEKTKEYKWMIKNCYKYGFILRFPKGKEYITGYQEEPWHYRYVGIPTAKYITKNNITLEEYYTKKLEK